MDVADPRACKCPERLRNCFRRTAQRFSAPRLPSPSMPPRRSVPAPASTDRDRLRGRQRRPHVGVAVPRRDESADLRSSRSRCRRSGQSDRTRRGPCPSAPIKIGGPLRTWPGRLKLAVTGLVILSNEVDTPPASTRGRRSPEPLRSDQPGDPSARRTTGARLQPPAPRPRIKRPPLISSTVSSLSLPGGRDCGSSYN